VVPVTRRLCTVPALRSSRAGILSFATAVHNEPDDSVSKRTGHVRNRGWISCRGKQCLFSPERIRGLPSLLRKGHLQLFLLKSSGWLMKCVGLPYSMTQPNSQVPSYSRTILRNDCHIQDNVICRLLHVFRQRMCSCLTNVYSAQRALNLVCTTQRPSVKYLFMFCTRGAYMASVTSKSADHVPWKSK
jgi:hypothetical protein